MTQDYRPLLESLGTRWRLLVAGSLVAAAIALLITSLIKPSYQAEATVALAKNSIQVDFNSKLKTTSDSDLPQLDQIARRRALTAIAGSPSLAINVIRKLGDRLPPALQTPVRLAQNISATGDGDLIRIRATASDSSTAALLANTWAQEYESRVNAIYAAPTFSLADVQAQAATFKQDYDRKEAALVAYVRDNPTASLERQLQVKQQALNDNYVQRNKYDRLLADAQALRQRLASRQPGDALAGQLASLFLEVRAFDTASSMPLGDKSSADVLPSNLQLHIDELNANVPPTTLLANLEGLVASIENRRQLLEREDISHLQEAVNRLQAQLEEESIRKKELTEERDLAWTSYTALINKVAEINVAAYGSSSVATLAGTALEPLEPSQTRNVLFAVLAAIVGLLLTASAVVIVDAYLPVRRHAARPVVTDTFQPAAAAGVQDGIDEQPRPF